MSASAGTQVSMCTAAVSSGAAPTLRYGASTSTCEVGTAKSMTFPWRLVSSWSTLRATTMMWSAMGESDTNFFTPRISKPSSAERTSVCTICRSEPPDSSEAPMHSTASPAMACRQMALNLSERPNRRRIAIAESCRMTPTPMPSEPSRPSFNARATSLATSGC
jgi:hypothetical protein